MSGEAPYLNCLCDHCSQKLEFPADAVGKEIDCPNCGQTTRLDWIQPKPSIPIPPPIRPPSADVLARETSERTRASKPPNLAVRSTPVVTGETGNSWVRTVVTVVITTVVLLSIGVPCIYVWQKRAQETEQVKQKTEQLKTELRLLEAQIQTGMSYADFLAQVARVRAAHLAARETLSHSQEIGYEKIDVCMEACAGVWNPDSVYHTTPVEDLERNVFPNVETTFGVKFDMDADLSYHRVIGQFLTSITRDIEAFLNDQPCPWPK